MFGSGNIGQNNWGGGRCPFQMDWTPALVNPRSAPDWQFRSFSPIECIRLLQQTSQQRGAAVLSADDSASRRKRAASEWWTVLCGSDAAFRQDSLAAGCRFSFKAPAPEQLEVSAVMGNVLLRDAHRLDFETEPEMEFTVVVTRVDDVACELRCI